MHKFGGAEMQSGVNTLRHSMRKVGWHRMFDINILIAICKGSFSHVLGVSSFAHRDVRKIIDFVDKIRVIFRHKLDTGHSADQEHMVSCKPTERLA